MVGKDIVTQSLNGLSSSFKSTVSQKQVKVSGSDFSKTMSDVQENQAKSANISVKDKNAADVSKGMKKLTDSDKPKMDSGERLEVKPEVKEAMKAADMAGKAEEDTVDEEMAAALFSGQIVAPELLRQGLGDLEDKISELVTEITGMTEEELMNLLEESGMQLVDLLNPDSLKQFVLEANDCEDAISLITNEDVAAQYNQLSAAMEEVETEDSTGITREEIVSLMERQPDMVKEATTKEDGREQVNPEESGQDVQKDTVKIVVEKDNGSQSMDNSSKEETLSRDSRMDMHRETTQEVKPLEVFVQNLASQGAEAGEEVSVNQLQTMREIVDQIVEQIKIAIKPESTSMELSLHPESLGRVNLTVASKNGLLTASFTAESQIAKEAIESQMQVLKDNLNSQGIKVEAVEVNVSQFAFKQNTESGADAQGQSKQQKKTGARRINLESFQEAEDTSEEEALAAKVLRDNGGTVDYTA